MENIDPTQVSDLQPATLVADDLTVDEAPVLREFGHTAAVSKAAKSLKLTRKMVVVGGLAIGGACVAFGLPLLNAKKAPEFKSGVSSLQIPPVETETPTIPLASPVLASAPVEEAAPDPVDLDSLDVNALPAPKTLEEAQIQINQIKEKLATADLSLSQAKERIAVMEVAAAEKVKAVTDSKPRHARKHVEKPVVEEESVALSILDINDERVLVADSIRPNTKIAVTPGAQLPGGAIFIGFDSEARMMKTDQGDFFIP